MLLDKIGNMDKIQLLQQKMQTLAPYSLHSRVHALNSFNTSLANSYLKREDELGFGVSGSKIRKYASLVPYLLENSVKAVLVIGGAYSNNVLGISQLLIENSIKPILFLLGDATQPRQGNLLLTSILVADEQIHWVARKNWPLIESIIAEYQQTHSACATIIPEGACMPEALLGALSLPLDILKNEQQLQQQFQHVFIDAGTGLTAIAVILAFAWLNKKIQIHVLLLADDESAFLNKLAQFQIIFEQLINENIDSNLMITLLKLYTPKQAKSFGAINANLFKFIKTIAREEGFFTDPIYSAKLLFEAKNIIQKENLVGNVLIIHSGGALTLMGFQARLY